jgi:hypothetical protein
MSVVLCDGIWPGNVLELAGVNVLGFVDGEQWLERKCLGFLPHMALRQVVSEGRTHVLVLGGEPVGYSIANLNKGTLRFFQVCVRRPDRLLAHGAALVEGWIRWAEERGGTVASCHCAADIDAVVFWYHCAFEVTGDRFRSRRRLRLQLKFERALAPVCQGHAARLRGPRLQHAARTVRVVRPVSVVAARGFEPGPKTDLTLCGELEVVPRTVFG